jgi:PAS domain S-box-containing protein
MIVPIHHGYEPNAQDGAGPPNSSFHGIEKQRRKLARKLAAAQLAHELAHEINNPLEALTNILFLLKSSSGDLPLHEEAEHQLSRISLLVRSILSLEDGEREVSIENSSRLLDPGALRIYKRRYEEAIHLAAIVEGAQDAIYSKKLDGTIMAWNTGAERLFGYSSAEALGRNIRMLVPRDSPGDQRHIMEKLREGKRGEAYEVVRQTKQGKLIRVSVSVSPIFDTSGKVVGASTIAREIQAISSEK